jgi:hypothetical protein
VQSTRPEDTYKARELGLDAEDFEDDSEDSVMLTAELIQEADDSTLERVETPEWGGHVFVRNPTGEEKNQFEQEGMVRRGRNREQNLRDLNERLVLWFACDAERKPLFELPDPSDPKRRRRAMLKVLEWLRGKNSAPINRIADMALRLGGWNEQDVEDMVGNSENGQS